MMEIRKNYFADERSDDGLKEIGQSRPRSDVPGHIRGITPFYADRQIPGLLHIRMVRSPYHHARIRAIDTSGLKAGATADDIVLRSTLGYTGSQSRIQMLQNRDFVDARVEVFGKHGSRTWVKMGEFQIDRQLLTE